MSPRDVVSASDFVPLSYRLLLTVVEPLFAVNGAMLVLLAPERYLSAWTLDDHLVFWATVPFLVVRVLVVVVIGIGVGPRDKGPKSE
ncbi:hypothetical protein MAJ_07344, partial [Metarhizium majus ARSEF 297]